MANNQREFMRIHAGLFLILTAGGSWAESPDLPDSVTADLSLRARTEYVNWLQAPGSPLNDNYTFSQTKLQFGLKVPGENLTAYLQGQHSQLYNLPVNGVGLGANYYALGGNERYPGDLLLRQANLQAQFEIGESKVRGLFGRFIYANGNEVKTGDKLLESLKARRIYNRVLGSFDFTLGRSFDGAQLSLDLPRYASLSGGWMRPTQGGFESDGSAQIEELNLATAAITSRLEDWPGSGELQLFTYYYDDSRGGFVKPDNRALELRQQDNLPIEIFNFGATWLQLYNPTEGLRVDTLLWGIMQSGDWGRDRHRAATVATELGLTFTDTPLQPETRLGWNYGTGDSDPNDNRHNTFFVMLPTVRQYALTPFFNSMNTHDLFIEETLTLSEKVRLQLGAHYLRLDSAADLLYAGAGANRSEGNFGISGSSLATKDIGTLIDITLGWTITKELSTQLYAGHLFGGDGIRENYQTGELTYAFLEMTLRL